MSSLQKYVNLCNYSMNERWEKIAGIFVCKNLKHSFFSFDVIAFSLFSHLFLSHNRLQSSRQMKKFLSLFSSFSSLWFDHKPPFNFIGFSRFQFRKKNETEERKIGLIIIHASDWFIRCHWFDPNSCYSLVFRYVRFWTFSKLI